MQTPLEKYQTIIAALRTQAGSLGASATGIIPATGLVIDARFARMCADPTPCPSYGLAPGCPPHAADPTIFRHRLADFHTVLVFKIDALSADLMGEKRQELARLIHRIAANLERSAVSLGMTKAQGMAAGSCKELFCGEQETCVVLSKGFPCLYPNLARPSISAVGVDFTALAALLGWPFGKLPSVAAADEPVMGLMAGLVLLG